jgi:hypothetical protein
LGGLSLVVFKVFLFELVNGRIYHRERKTRHKNQHTSEHTIPTSHNKQFKMCTQKVQIYNLLLHKVAAKIFVKVLGFS